MPQNAILQDQASLVEPNGSCEESDQIVLVILFGLGLIEVNTDRRFVLTQLGRKVFAEFEHSTKYRVLRNGAAINSRGEEC